MAEYTITVVPSDPADVFAWVGSIPVPPGHRIEAHECDQSELGAIQMERHDRTPVWAKLVVAPMKPLTQWEIDFCTGDFS
jgi:hypothetical protein